MGTPLAFHPPGSPQPLTTSPHWQLMHWELQLQRGTGRAGQGQGWPWAPKPRLQQLLPQPSPGSVAAGGNFPIPNQQPVQSLCLLLNSSW